ncbi:MAG: BamA/TamA family outer membrane protein [Flavobacteriales bacterium]|nr:BamA/TamA family outer membrane protein [Flavobacteriales bacterium]
MRTSTLMKVGASALLLSSCSGLKHATTERPLFAGVDLEWEQAPVEDVKRIGAELEGVVRPAANNRFLGMRPTVALHNAIKEPKKPKGFRNLLKNKIGSAPVYLEDVPLGDINAAFENRLNNHGYFAARSRYEVQAHGRTARVVFYVHAGIPHRLRTITYADSTDTLNTYIARARDGSPLEPEQLYDLALLEAERNRVVGTLRNEGWYHLKDDDLVFAADTASATHVMDIRLRLKRATGTQARQRFTLGAVRVHGDHDALLPPTDSLLLDSLLYINTLNNYRPSTILLGVFLRPGQFYSAQRSDQTSQYLSSYGVFKSTQVQYAEDSLRPGILDADVLLVPQKRWSLFTELNAVSKSNNFAGPGARMGFKDRNLFRGAEVFTTDINGRFETQVAGAQKGTNAYEVGIKVALQIPRIVPFGFLRSVRSSAPSTRADIGYGFFRRVGLYGLESFNTSFGYVWRHNPRVWHDVRLLDVSYNSLYYSSAQFSAFLDTNLVVARSFEEQFIVGMAYTYTVTTRKRNSDAGYLLASMAVDESGDLLSAGFSLGGPRPEGGYRLFDRTFSQYVRFRPELRYYSRMGRRGDRVVARLLAGVALPYGNSDVVPYVKQFFVGGTNSVRAFRARSVGPGIYVPDATSGVLIDQTGDIRFEGNIEYRFTIAGFFKGAVFGDAGNIWLVNDDPQRPGGDLEWSHVLSELAVGAGFGLRFDPEVIVVRLDLATPLRQPSLPVGDRWVFNDLRPRIFDNVVFNIAIGYPF